MEMFSNDGNNHLLVFPKKIARDKVYSRYFKDFKLNSCYKLLLTALLLKSQPCIKKIELLYFHYYYYYIIING